MSPHGAVIWLLAAATWAVLLVPSIIVLRRRRARAVLITDAEPPVPHPARPDLDEYTDDVPASGAAWAVGRAPDENEGR